jgi:hypothetical protein
MLRRVLPPRAALAILAPPVEAAVPSVSPGRLSCDSRDCAKRRHWKARYNALPAAAKTWLRRTRRCESGGRYGIATGNGFYGAYQFSASTSRLANFSMLPHLVYAREQDVRAWRWRLRTSRSQWPNCAPW